MSDNWLEPIRPAIPMHWLWDDEKIPEFEEFLEEIDAALMKELESDQLHICLDLYNFFDSPEKPLNPREFLHFWVSLDEAERAYYIVNTTEPLASPVGLSGYIMENYRNGEQ